MKKNKGIHKELSELSPFLEQFKKDNPKDGFVAPQNYFDTLHQQITDQTKPALTSKKSWLESLSNFLSSYLHLQYAVRFAAIALLVLAGIWSIFSEQATDTNVALSDIPEEEIQVYLDQNLDELTAEWLVENGDFEELFEQGSAFLHDEDLNEYIDETLEDIDFSDLEDLL